MSETRHLLLLCALLAAALWPGTGIAEPPLRDPTRPPDLRPAKAQKAPAARRWHLAFTLVSGGRRSAVINGRIVGVGERIAGARVLAIEPGRVRLRARGREFNLLLLPQNVKKASRNEGGKS